VWLLGWVSLATDAATEAVYPLLPFFLTRILRTSAISIGVIEGAAEATSSLLKIFAGQLADRWRHKRPLVIAGYTISSLSRPFVAAATVWTGVFAVRVLDRVGKGIRTAPRDAMLAAWATSASRGKVYGFHRGMDHLGAVVGPVLASLFLYFYPERYRLLFALTIVPGVVAVALLFLVPEPEGSPGSSDSRTLAGRADAPIPLPRSFGSFMLVLLLFTLGNSTDAFLLLRLTDAAGTVKNVPLMWAALHLVKAAVSIMCGGWSDRIGRRAVITAGWLVYAVVYAGFALSTTIEMLFAWFLLYGVYYGFAEGAERALVADLAPAERLGFAFGVYNAVTGLGALAASLLFGFVWTIFGAAAAFGLGSALALVATALLFAIINRPHEKDSRDER